MSTLCNIKCDILHCKFYQRNGRNREEYDKNNNNKKEEKHDENALIYIEILDTIHTYFIHSYDTGFRFKSKYAELEKINDNNDDNDDNNDFNNICIDKEMILLEKYLNKKRQNLKTIRGKDRMQKNKFLTNFSLVFTFYISSNIINVFFFFL